MEDRWPFAGDYAGDTSGCVAKPVCESVYEPGAVKGEGARSWNLGANGRNGEGGELKFYPEGIIGLSLGF